MSLFFIISGYLIKDSNNVITYKKVISLVRNYMIPYFIYCFANLAVQLYLIRIGYKWTVAFKQDYRKYLWGIATAKGGAEWIPNCSTLWYLTAIFLAMFIYLTINTISNASARNCMLGLCPIISYCLHIKGLNKLWWNLDTALMGVLFLEIGYVIRKSGILDYVRNMELVKKLLCFIVIAGIGYYSIYYNPIDIVSFAANSYGNFFMMIAGAVSIAGAILGFAYMY